MQKKISLCFFVDALGWEIVKENGFLEDIIPVRKKLKSILGYTSTCVPSILTGVMPARHGYWSTYFYSPKTSPFKILFPLSLLPKAITSRARVRGIMSKVIKNMWTGMEGYFQLYSFPFKYLRYFDYYEKENFYEVGSLGTTKTIFDYMDSNNIPFYCHLREDSDQVRFEKLEEKIEKSEVRFSYMSLGKVDAVFHMNDRYSDIAKNSIREYEKQIRNVYDLALQYYEDVQITVFSDHDMATTNDEYDVMKDINSLGLKFGKDYAVVYDSTMGRFWFFNEDAKKKITEKLQAIAKGRIVPEKELKELGVYFENHRFGELIFLMKEGTLIVPSFMGAKAIPGMHGYHPDDKHSFSIIMSNREFDIEVEELPDIFDAMLSSVGLTR